MVTICSASLMEVSFRPRCFLRTQCVGCSSFFSFVVSGTTISVGPKKLPLLFWILMTGRTLPWIFPRCSPYIADKTHVRAPGFASPHGSAKLQNMLSPHLSSTPLGTGRYSDLPGIHSGVWLLPDPWESNPSVVLTELRTEVSLCCDGSMLYIGSNPILTGRFALPPPNGDRCVHPLMWLPITGLCLKNGM